MLCGGGGAGEQGLVQRGVEQVVGIQEWVDGVEVEELSTVIVKPLQDSIAHFFRNHGWQK